MPVTSRHPWCHVSRDTWEEVAAAVAGRPSGRALGRRRQAAEVEVEVRSKAMAGRPVGEA